MKVTKENGKVLHVGYIYRHWIINDNGLEKSYIGQTTQSPCQRWQGGCGYKNTLFGRAINKYGWEAFHHDIIGVVESETVEQLILDLNEWETFYIWKYGSFTNGYNSTSGGDSGMTMSEESNYKKSISKMGELNPMYGKHMSEEHKQRLREANMNREITQETRDKISNARKGMQFTEEHLANLSLAHMGHKHSDEAKAKMSESRTGDKHWRATKVVCVNTGDIFDTIKQAQDWCGSSKVCECCKKKRKSAGKHPETGEKTVWMYYEDYLKTKENDEDGKRENN